MTTSNNPSPAGEQYSHGYQAHNVILTQRTAQTHARFFTPHLKPGMSLLDCGCGPGTITNSFAVLLDPGQVVGIDIGEPQLERAKAAAEEQGIKNVRFEKASAYELPFPDEEFDAVFAHTLLQHVKEPEMALKEMHRVLKSGGVIGVREEDHGATLTWPDYPGMTTLMNLYLKYWQSNGGNPYLARYHKKLLREASFVNIVASTDTTGRVNTDATKMMAEMFGAHIREPGVAESIMEMGGFDRDELELMIRDVTAWGDDPNAIHSQTIFEALGWKA